MLPKIIVCALVITLGIFAWFNFAPKHPPAGGQPSNNQQAPQQTNKYINNPFYSKDGISITHTWPGETFFSNEETEVLIFNESDSQVTVKSFDLTYSVEGKTYPHKSGTWEKFARKDSHERIEYINISPKHYQGQPLNLAQSQKGKLHWHINFGSTPLNGKQTVHVKLTLIKDGQTIIIDEQFNRESGQVFSKDNH